MPGSAAAGTVAPHANGVVDDVAIDGRLASRVGLSWPGGRFKPSATAAVADSGYSESISPAIARGSQVAASATAGLRSIDCRRHELRERPLDPLVDGEAASRIRRDVRHPFAGGQPVLLQGSPIRIRMASRRRGDVAGVPECCFQCRLPASSPFGALALDGQGRQGSAMSSTTLLGVPRRRSATSIRHAPEDACRRQEVARRGANPLWAGLKPSLGPCVSRRRRTRTTSRAEDCGNPASAGRRCPR